MNKALKGYITFCYRLLGSFLDKMEDEDIEKMLYQADIEMTPGMFLSFCIFTATIVSLFTFVLSYVIITLLI